MKTSFTVLLALLAAGCAMSINGTATAAEATPVAQPGRILSYEWKDGAWSAPTVITRTYTPDGKLSRETVTEPGSQVAEMTEYTYNQDGLPEMVMQSEMDINIQERIPGSRVLYTYDPVARDFCTEMLTEIHYKGKWFFHQSETCEVTRNAEGNVTEILYSQDGRQKSSVRVEYGTDGSASKISRFSYYDGSWHLSCTWSEIVWHETDGQLLFPADELYLENLMRGRNRISSARQVYDAKSSSGVPTHTDVTIEVEYTDDGGYTATKEGIEGNWTIDGGGMWYTPLENGGHDSGSLWKYKDIFDLYRTSRVEYDAWHNMLLNAERYHYSIDPKYSDYEKGEVTYSPETGFPETCIIKTSDYDTDYGDDGVPLSLRNKEKYEFSDYVTSGIGTVTTDSDGPVEYYDLNGLRVDRPYKGIYIMRHNGKTTKIIL